jgi:hypothetical protein
VISDLKEESKTRDLSAGEIEWLRKTISDLADLPGVLPPEE